MGRSFGVEFEFAAHHNQNDQARIADQYGIELYPRPYGHSDGRQWEAKTDSTARHAEGGAGYEIASRALHGDAGLKELEFYCTVLTRMAKANNWKVHKGCGFHVHIDTSDYSMDDLRRLVRMVMHYESAFFCLNAPSRIGNNYTRSVRGMELENYEILAGLRGEDTDSTRRELLNSIARRRDHFRYFGMNLTHFIVSGRIEFRYGSGTLNARKAAGWVNLLVSLVEKAKNADRVRVNPQVEGEGAQTIRQRKEALRRGMSNLRAIDMTYRVGVAHKTIEERFEKFGNNLGSPDATPAYRVRGF